MISKAFFNDFVTRKSTFYCGVYGLISIYISILGYFSNSYSDDNILQILGVFYFISIIIIGINTIFTIFTFFISYLISLFKNIFFRTIFYLLLLLFILILGFFCAKFLYIRYEGPILGFFCFILGLPITALFFLIPNIVLLKKEKNNDYRIKNTNLTTNKYYRFFITLGYLHNIFTFFAFWILLIMNP